MWAQGVAPLVVEAFGRHAGVLSSAQLDALGVGSTARARWLRAGLLRRVHRGVYALGAAPLTLRGHWMAAHLALGEGSAVSHLDALAGHDLRATSAARVHVTAPGRSGRQRRDGLVVHRSPLRPQDVVVLDGIPVTSVARTLLDSAALLTRDRLCFVLERAELLRVYDHRAVLDVLAAARGRHEVPRLRAALEAYDPRLVAARSGLERAFVTLLADHGEDDDLVVAHVDPPYEIDVCFPAARLIVELEGGRYHLTRGQHRRDVRRDAELARHGWLSVRVLDEDVDRRPDHVRATIRELRAQRG